MRHFAYPTIKVTQGKFTGCGRYIAAEPSENLHEQGYDHAVAQKTERKADLLTAAAILATECAHSDKNVYLKQDIPQAQITGDSWNLAYLLALISRSRDLREHLQGDIWCTGKVSLEGQSPRLREVDPEGLSFKLQAFLSEKENQQGDPLFIVAVPMFPEDRALCQKHHANLVSVEQFKQIPIREFSSTRTVLLVNGDELEDLVKLLFLPPKYARGVEPYKGLTAFRQEDAEFFFGREAYTRQLAETIDAKPFVAVIGPSGCGKSSLVYAGLLPQLTKSGKWLVRSFRPGHDPFQALCNALLPLLYDDEVSLMREMERLPGQLRDHSIDLKEIIKRILKKHDKENLLIFVDQFEELYTLCANEQEQHRFLDLLLSTLPISPSPHLPTSPSPHLPISPSPHLPISPSFRLFSHFGRTFWEKPLHTVPLRMRCKRLP